MTDRLPWQPAAAPNAFVACPTGNPADGHARIFYGPYYDGHAMRWQVRIEAGGTVVNGISESKQDAADFATHAWPRACDTEREIAAAIEDVADLLTMLDAAEAAGVIDVAAFAIEASSSERLLTINWHLSKRSLHGPLKPLAASVSLELYRRRIAGVPATGMGIYSTGRVAEFIMRRLVARAA